MLLSGKYTCTCTLQAKTNTHVMSGVHLRGGEGGPSPPLEKLLSLLGSKFHIFLQSYCEMIKGITTRTCTLNRYSARLSVPNVKYCF